MRSLLKEPTAVVVKRTHMRCVGFEGFCLPPLRLAVPRRLLALAIWLIEHHVASPQPDVIKPEAKYVKMACEFP